MISCFVQKEREFYEVMVEDGKMMYKLRCKIVDKSEGTNSTFQKLPADGATSAVGRLVFSQLVQNSRDRIHGLLMNQLQYITEINISYCSMYVFYYETK
jgi:hypothetical protein